MEKQILHYDIAIIGGGAAGLAAAVCCAKKTAKKKEIKIAVLEKENKVGRKLLATGNGKCNITNENMSSKYYNQSGSILVESVLARYSPQKLISFLGSLGLVCKADTAGRVYPLCGQASAVLDILRINLQALGVEELCGVEIKSITKDKGGYRLLSKDTVIYAESVILAAGGKAQPNLGSDGASYSFAKMLSLECTPTFPSLVPVKCENKYFSVMKGVRTGAEVSLVADGVTVHSESGELQLNESNLSGICIFQLSRLVNEFLTLHSINGVKYQSVSIAVDFMPDFSLDEVEKMLFRRRKQLEALNTEDFLTGILNKKIGLYLVKRLDIFSPTRKANTLSDDEIFKLAETIKHCEFLPDGMSGFNTAQVTAGGISVKEVDKNMECLKHKNLFIAGEALDVDGMCGGYNLHWAFSSGIIAGNAAAERYKR